MSVYDYLWPGNDEKRKERIAELEDLDIAMAEHLPVEARDFAARGINAYIDIGKLYGGYKSHDMELSGLQREGA